MKIYELLDLRACKCFWNTPQTNGKIDSDVSHIWKPRLNFDVELNSKFPWSNLPRNSITIPGIFDKTDGAK